LIFLRVPASLVYRDVVSRVALGACKLAAAMHPEEGIEADFGEAVVSAVGEAFNNAVLHAYRERPPGDVSLEIEILTDGVSVRLRDAGAPFDPSAVKSPDLDEMPESGMGLHIIRSCMDEVTYVAGPPNELRLVRHFSRNARAPSG
jgi:serine/threonine-protein kinase RsbW